MIPTIERDLLGELSSSVAAYLAAMTAMADCLEQASPDVGGPYRQRIHRLRSRVSYDASRRAIKESVPALEAELKEYAAVASRVRAERTLELESGVLALRDIIEDLTQRQEFYSTHLRQFAEQVEKATRSEDPKTQSQVIALQTAGLRTLVESMNQEAASMVNQMREQMITLDRRIAGAASTDPVTGLNNRTELERHMEALKLRGTPFSLLVFEVSGALSDEVLHMAAAKLGSQFRHRDRTARWSYNEFAVLFVGESELAEARAEQVTRWVSGRYVLENGETVVISAEGRLLKDMELVAA